MIAISGCRLFIDEPLKNATRCCSRGSGLIQHLHRGLQLEAKSSTATTIISQMLNCESMFR